MNLPCVQASIFVLVLLLAGLGLGIVGCGGGVQYERPLPNGYVLEGWYGSRSPEVGESLKGYEIRDAGGYVLATTFLELLGHDERYVYGLGKPLDRYPSAGIDGWFVLDTATGEITHWSSPMV